MDPVAVGLMQIIINNLVGLLGVTVVVIYFMTKTRKELNEMQDQNKKVLLYDKRMNFVMDNFYKIEHFVDEYISGGTRVIDKIIHETDMLGRKLDENFTNGSSEEKARMDLNSYYESISSFIANEAAHVKSPHKYMWLVDIIVENVEILIKNLSYLIELDMKYKLLNPYLTSINNMIAYFVASQGTFDVIDDEKEFKIVLRTRFREDGRRRKLIFKKRDNPTL